MLNPLILAATMAFAVAPANAPKNPLQPRCFYSHISSQANRCMHALRSFDVGRDPRKSQTKIPSMASQQLLAILL